MPGSITISYTTLAELLLASVLIGGVIFISKNPANGTALSDGDKLEGTATGGKKSKSKKKKSAVGKPTGGNDERDVKEVIFEEKVELSTKEGKKEKKKVLNTPIASTAPLKAISKPLAIPTPQATSPPSSATTSFASVVAPSSSSSSSAPLNSESNGVKQTYAESHRKAVVPTPLDDMRDETIDPSEKIARVVRISGPKIEEPVEPEGEWEDPREEEEGAWETTKAKKPTKSIFSPISSSSSSFNNSNPSPKSIPGLSSSAQVELTKKQRENSKKTARLAVEKEEMERERLERLRIHRKGLENSRMAEQETQRNKNKPKPGAPRSINIAAQRQTQSQQGATKAKEQSGGMRASLNDDGKLIWE